VLEDEHPATPPARRSGAEKPGGSRAENDDIMVRHGPAGILAAAAAAGDAFEDALVRACGVLRSASAMMKKKQTKAAKKATKPVPTRTPWAKVRGSKIHGRGMFASKVIPKGTRVIEYSGERITKAEGWRRELARQERGARGGDGCIYIFELNTKVDIDGSVLWNTARYINHSCDPNCESQVVRGRVWIVAIRDIAPGEELSYDYYYDYDHYHEHPCRCGADNCAGYIVKAPVRWRVRHSASRLKRKKTRRRAA
jgi:hypothetical protein